MANTLRNGEQYASFADFAKGVDLSVWDMATQCASCHVGGGLVEKDREGTRLSMRGMAGPQPLNAYDWYAFEMFDPATGAPRSYNSNLGANMPVNADGSPASLIDGFGAAMAPWAMPATSDFKPLKPDHSNAVMAPAGWVQAGNPYINLGMAVEGQAMMPNVREMDCLFCHLEGYNNIVSSVATQMGYLMASPSLGSGLMNMFTMAYQQDMVTLGTGIPMQTGLAYPVKLSGSVISRLKPEPPDANCRQCHIPTTMANFSDMFDKFLAAAPMSYEPDSPYASAINGMAMPTFDLNAPFVPTGSSPSIYFNPYNPYWWEYGDSTAANGPFGIFPMALDSTVDVMAAAMTGSPIGGGNPAQTGPLYYAGISYDQGTPVFDQNALKKATIPFPRADFFKRGDNWDGTGDDVHYNIGCAGCHFNTNSQNPDLTQCDPGRGYSRMGGIENGFAGIDTRSTVKRCQDCHVSGTNFDGTAINTFNAPNPAFAHQNVGLLANVAQAVRLNTATGQEETFLGNHLDIIACQVCHVDKKAMSVRALDSTSGNRYPTIIGIQGEKGMLAMFTDPMPDHSMINEPVEWKPLYGWDEREQKKLSNGSWNPNWRREIIPINMITAAMWDDVNGPEDQNGDGAEAWNAAHPASPVTIEWDPPIQRDMKAGMNFAPGPFATIPIGFGGGQYQSAFMPDFTFSGAWDYVGIYGGNVIFTNPDQIQAYKQFRDQVKDVNGNNGKTWAGTELTYFGGNPFQIEHGVVPTSFAALGKGGCTDCHASGSGFFSGGYDMTGTAIPASREFPAGTVSNMMQRPAVDIEVTAYKGDLRTGSEAKSKKNGSVFDVKFEEDGTWDPVGKTFTPGTATPNATQTTDLSRSEFLYPHPESQSWADFYYDQPDLKGHTFSSIEERVAYLESINLESIDHTATPGSGPVVIFADTDHDDAGWRGAKPYFDVTVNCALCHDTDLPTIHGNDCATCHPTPFDTLGVWNKGCQQGGCHPAYHQNSTTAHLPFEDAYDPENTCSLCHDQSWAVPQTNCLNCHAAPVTGYANPPVTTSNALSFYDGAAEIDFSIKVNGKVAIGRTFYRLDGGEVASGSKVLVNAGGSHDLEFWSVDQYGNTETSTHIAYFTISQDTIPPTTTSNAKPTYYQGALITLTATDDSTQGVKATYYSLNGGPAQTGTTVSIPATSGTIGYTLDFWSVDWSGNVETRHSVTFTVISGNGTLHLVWWDCDLYPGQAPSGIDWANWTVRRGGPSGYVVATGSGASPNWSGINDIPVQVGETYFVFIKWWNSEEGDFELTDFPNVYVATPGQMVRLSY